MTAQLNPYLNFRGQAREAMDFYRAVFGGDLEVMTFAQVDSDAMKIDPVDADKVMHARLATPAGFTLMASDVPQAMVPTPNGCISITGDADSSDDLHRYWDKLTDHALQIDAPLGSAPWGDEFGMLTDKFGVPWMIDIGTREDRK